jgi:hypothetical protein
MLAEAHEEPDVKPNPKMELVIHPEDRRTGQVIDRGNARQAIFF